MTLKSLSLVLGVGLALAADVSAGELRGFRSAADLESYLESVAIDEMEREIIRPPILYRTMAGTAGGAAAGHSTTNVQVKGVDEPDFVKNDAGYIYKLVGESLAIVDAVPASRMRELSRLKIEGSPHAMFLLGDMAVVFSSAPAPAGMERPQHVGPYAGGHAARMAIWWQPQAQITKITEVDVWDRRAPQVLRETYIEGGFVDARRVGTEIHLVTSARPPGPELQYWTDWSRQPTQAETDAIKAENRRRIRAAKLDDWLPRQLDTANSASPASALRASACFRPGVAEGRNFVTVTTMDTATWDAPKSVGIVAEQGEVYASASSLYMACYRWRYWSATGVGAEPGDESDIHRFRIGLPGGPSYVGTGTVEGRVLNQFAMDELNGALRVATTTEAAASNGRPQLNHVFVLKKVRLFGRKLDTVGSIRDIAPNERIYSVRFMGDRGFVVTFRQVDPLFAIDMRRLRVKGELKVDGFSTYLHPVGARHLLAVGNAADPQTGRVTGLELSLFDVSDLASPKLAHRVTLPGAYSQSLYEHKAFNFFEATGTLAVPVSDWTGTTGFSGLEVYDVSLATGFKLRGRVDHADLARQQGWTWSPEVSRSAIIGAAIYSISDAGIKANRSAAPATEYGKLVVIP